MPLGLPGLPNLPSLGGGGFLPIGTQPTIPGIGYPTGGPIQINVPVRGGVVLGGGTPTAPQTTSASMGGVTGLLGSWVLGALGGSVVDAFLRIVLLVLGFICVIGAIYLFKPTQEVLGGATEHITRAARAVASTAGE
jgi:hypothetical protein